MGLKVPSAYAALGPCTTLMTVVGLQQLRWTGCLGVTIRRSEAATSASTAQESQSSPVISGGEF